jgi:hypothetical protein
MEKASNTARLDTVSATSSSLVRKREISLPKIKHRTQIRTPIIMDVLRIISTENFAALGFPLPNSFATLTLNKIITQIWSSDGFICGSINSDIEREWKSYVSLGVPWSAKKAKAKHEFPCKDVLAETIEINIKASSFEYFSVQGKTSILQFS